MESQKSLLFGMKKHFFCHFSFIQDLTSSETETKKKKKKNVCTCTQFYSYFVYKNKRNCKL